MATGARSIAAVNHHGRGRVGEQSPYPVQLAVGRIEFADLNVHLEDPGAGLQRLADVPVDGRFEVERPARDAARRIGGEFPRPAFNDSAIPGWCGYTRAG
jgi:hypothetical protein